MQNIAIYFTVWDAVLSGGSRSDHLVALKAADMVLHNVCSCWGHQPMARSCAARQFQLNEAKLEWRGLIPFQTIVRLTSQARSKKPVPTGPAALEAIADTEEQS